MLIEPVKAEAKYFSSLCLNGNAGFVKKYHIELFDKKKKDYVPFCEIVSVVTGEDGNLRLAEDGEHSKSFFIITDGNIKLPMNYNQYLSRYKNKIKDIKEQCIKLMEEIIDQCDLKKDFDLGIETALVLAYIATNIDASSCSRLVVYDASNEKNAKPEDIARHFLGNYNQWQGNSIFLYCANGHISAVIKENENNIIHFDTLSAKDTRHILKLNRVLEYSIQETTGCGFLTSIFLVNYFKNEFKDEAENALISAKIDNNEYVVLSLPQITTKVNKKNRPNLSENKKQLSNELNKLKEYHKSLLKFALRHQSPLIEREKQSKPKGQSR